MSDSDFSTTYNADGTVHEVQVPIKKGLRITVPAGIKGAPPAPTKVDALDFYQWPSWLCKAERSSGNDIVTTLGGSSTTEPAIQHLADYTPGGDSGSPDTAPRRFTDSEWNDIILRNRGDVATARAKLFLGKDPGRNAWGWAYNGVTVQAAGLAPSQRPKGAPHTLEWAQDLLWEELAHEGGYASINAYDPGKLTWGQGWAMTGAGSGLPGLMKRLWISPACAGLRKAFLEHGIAWDVGTSRYKVVNPDGYLETGPSALELLIGSPDLLAVFIKLGEAPAFRQALVDVEFDQLSGSPIGKVPESVYRDTEDRLIMLMAHVGHMWGAHMWKHPQCKTVHDFLMAWGASGWKKRGSGGRTLASGQILNNLQHWGRGIAWTDAVSKISPGVVGSFTDKDIDDPVNQVHFDGLLCIWNPEQKGFHFYPKLPPLLLFDDELFAWCEKWAGHNMTTLLAAAKDLGSKAKDYRSVYPRSERTIGSFGMRPYVALDAGVVKKAGAPKGERDRLYASVDCKALPEDQVNDIRKFLGDKPAAKAPWDYWDAQQPNEFFNRTHHFSMDALLSTYGARGYGGADKLRLKYEELGQYLGPRPWVAIMTVLNRGGGQAASWIVNHGGYRGLGRDQRKSVRKALGLPHSDDVLDAEGLG